MSHWSYSVRESEVRAFCACFRATENCLHNNRLSRFSEVELGILDDYLTESRIYLCKFLLFRWL